MTTVSQSIGAITVSGTNSAPGEPITYTLSSSIGQVAGLTADDILNATYAPDPTNPASTLVTFGNGKIIKTSNAKAKSIQLSADSAINSISDQLDNPAPAPPSTNPTSPIVPGGTGSPTTPNTLTGPASGDSGASNRTTGNNPTSPKGASGGSAGSPGSPAINSTGKTTNNASSPVNPPASGPASNTNTSASMPSDNTPPGKRLQNPLGQFASYTYQISLYMITPDAYNLFVASGRTNINAFNTAVNAATATATGAAPTGGGVFLVAQSGGINNTNEKRAAGFNFDYYIDNLIMQVQTSGTDSGSATNTTDIEFTITEPYGFSFISNLKRASAAINQYAQATNSINMPNNPSKQLFILGIRFYGYDQLGRIVKPESTFNGNSLDPNSLDGSLFEHFYDITIYQLDFKIDGKMTTYKCTGATLAPKAAFSIKNGLIETNKTITGSTVSDVLNKLMAAINAEQEQKVKNKIIQVPNKYSVRFSTAEAENIIGSATIVSKADLDKSKLPGSSATDSAASTASAEVNAAVNVNSKDFVFNQGHPILQCIDGVIKQSSYLENALNVIYDALPANDPNKKTIPSITNPSNTPISWYTCTSSVSGAKWDNIQKDWIFNIEYVINKYDTPVVSTAVAGSTPKYYGPHKRYNYWYTGLNSEILSYDQSLNNSYFNSNPGPSNPANQDPANGTANTNNLNTPSGSSIKSNIDQAGRQGLGSEAQNSYLTSLYDPGSWQNAEITILGDPDYLIDVSGSPASTPYSQFYGRDGYTINPNGGQVFIEIDFKEGVDYVMGGGLNADGSSTQGGTLNINNSILFVDYPKSVANLIHGVSYTVNHVECTFRNGSFKQKLDLILNDFGGDATASNTAASGNTSTSTSSTPTPGAKGQPPAPNNSPPVALPLGANGTATPTSPTGGAPSKQTPAAGTTPTGPNGAPVANGDANGR